MTEALSKSLRHSAAARWISLAIVSFSMLCGYYVADVASPLKPLLEQQLKWTSAEYGFFTGAYAWFNVAMFMLIIGGILLDKLGARLTGILACILMVAGCTLKWWAVTTHVLDGGMFFGTKTQVWVAALGYAVFGVGIEIVGVTATKVIARWFKGYEIALAMGLQVGTARIGTSLAVGLGGPIAEKFHQSIGAPILVGVVLLSFGLVAYIIYCAMDRRLDETEGLMEGPSEEDAFRLSDIADILRIRGFWYVTILCALFYSGVFPFIKYAPDLMVQKFGVRENLAGSIPSILPIAAIPLTWFFGWYYDKKGKGATLMVLGSLLLVAVHFVFAVPFLNSWVVALVATIFLGFAFALVPSAMWPSIPRFIPHRQLGTAYGLIFWTQNLLALWVVPYLIGWVLDKYCIVGTRVSQAGTSPAYNYGLPMAIFTVLGVLAVVFGLLLKAEDKAKGFGLELPSRG
ncbi:MFS transporter [Mesoterricola sediminis]|uniref:Lysosomal dipeptide transporter MFSD1 n=1 Tax=Mesoterricola sediminis TaxID=2927980 RepID=A0AA48GLP3_9BACT|nr:MFS transporter [Mesoterricola sediminis]BDU75371.1 MFS transporter [Mesoterricola sediminis]